jgi:hypothetical protein
MRREYFNLALVAKITKDIESNNLSKDSFTLAKGENPLITTVQGDKPKDIFHAIDYLGCDINLQNENGHGFVSS